MRLGPASASAISSPTLGHLAQRIDIHLEAARGSIDTHAASHGSGSHQRRNRTYWSFHGVRRRVSDRIDQMSTGIEQFQVSAVVAELSSGAVEGKPE